MNHEAIYALYPEVITIDDGAGAFDKDGNKVEIDDAAVEEKAAELEAQAPLDACKAEAKQRLADTDWSVLPDVVVKNKLEFETYRSQIRALVLNPVADPVWPTEPQPVWE